MTINDKKRV